MDAAKSYKSGAIKLLVLGVIIGLLSYAAYTIFFVFYLTGGMVDTVNHQLAAIRAGDITLAYSYTSKDFQHITPFDDFKKFIVKYPSLKNNESASISSREIKDNLGTITGELHSKDGATAIEYHLVKEDGVWKILNFKLMPVKTTVASSESTPPASDTILLPNLYQNRLGEYTINYPDDWYYDQANNGSVVFSGKSNTPSYYSTVNIQMVITKKAGGKFSTPEQLIESLKKQAQSQASDVRILAEDSINLPESTLRKEMEGYYFVMTYTYKGQKFQQLQFVFKRHDGQLMYAFAYTAPKEQYQVDYAIAKAMFATWTVS